MLKRLQSNSTLNLMQDGTTVISYIEEGTIITKKKTWKEINAYNPILSLINKAAL